MSPEVSGLRKRMTSFNPRNISPVDKMRVRHEDNGDAGNEYDEKSAEDAFTEGLSHSFSSISSRSSRSIVDDDRGGDGGPVASSRDTQVNANVASPEEIISQPSSKKKFVESSRSDLPRVPPGVTRPSFRVPSSRDIKYTHNNVSSPTSSWLGLDLSIIVALVSPIGNLLTGSDHIKNVILLLLLIYYLHQLVEVPWTLYRMSVPSGGIHSPALIDGDSTKLAAHAELRALEMLYLVLTVLSPFIGATLLRYVATTISGKPDTLSWFSTSLFVLATGVRPWSHLVERLKDRSRALTTLLESNEEVNGPCTPTIRDAFNAEINGEVSNLRGKFDSLGEQFSNFTSTSTRELDDLGDAIDGIVVSVRRYQAETNKKIQDCDTRLGSLEAFVLDLHRREGQKRREPLGPYMRGARLRAVLWDVAALPWTLSAIVWAFACGNFARIFPDRTSAGNYRPLASTHSTVRPSALETIMEEDMTSPDHTPGSYFPTNISDRTLVVERIPHHHTAVQLAVDTASRLFALVLSPAIFAIRMLFLLLDLSQTVFRAATR